jgi:hypothetical protein
MGEIVTVANFARAETARYFAQAVVAGAFGRMTHYRRFPRVERQNVIRMNFDTLYSTGVFDVTEPVTVHLPDPGGRYVSLVVINQDHHVALLTSEPGDYVIDQEVCGSRYAMVVVRILVDATDPDDLAAVHALQDQISTEQSDSGSYEPDDWDVASLDEVRRILLELDHHVDSEDRRRFGAEDEVHPVSHLVASASGWGGLPDRHVRYVYVYPTQDSGEQSYQMRVSDVPCDGFWSITVYNARGYVEANDAGVYSLNDLNTVAETPGGDVLIHLGGDPSLPNHLPIMAGWNYIFRIYLPHDSVLNGEWQPPHIVAITQRS